MRKSITPLPMLLPIPPQPTGGSILQQIASAEISSEDPLHPFENALQRGEAGRLAGCRSGPASDSVEF